METHGVNRECAFEKSRASQGVYDSRKKVFHDKRLGETDDAKCIICCSANVSAWNALPLIGLCTCVVRCVCMRWNGMLSSAFTFRWRVRALIRALHAACVHVFDATHK